MAQKQHIEQQQGIAQQPKRITHISDFMLFRLVVFVNDASCFNSCGADSPDETRNTGRFSTLSRNTAGRMDPEVHGARLARGAASHGAATHQ